MAGIVWLVVVLLLVFWGIGFFFSVLGSFIHVLLVLAVVLAVGYMLRGAGSRGAA